MKSIYLIGNTNECQKYLENIDNVNLLPLNNLPVVYFPFQYNKKNSNDDNMKYFSKIIEKENIIVNSTGDSEYYCDVEPNTKHTHSHSHTDTDTNTHIDTADTDIEHISSHKSAKCSNLSKLFDSISNIETEWQPYNNNNINIILIIIIIIWIIILFVILKILHFFLGTSYSIFMIILTCLLMIISIIYSLLITANNF